jgi:hypothetical protein
LDVKTGKTSAVGDSVGSCELPLSRRPKVVTYRNLAEALANPLDVHILDLSHQKFTQLPSDIERLENLEILNLEFVLNLELPASIGALSQLRELNLRNTFLRTMPVEIAQLRRLQTLKLGGTKLSQAERERIRVALPGCKIE